MHPAFRPHDVCCWAMGMWVWGTGRGRERPMQPGELPGTERPAAASECFDGKRLLKHRRRCGRDKAVRALMAFVWACVVLLGLGTLPRAGLLLNPVSHDPHQKKIQAPQDPKPSSRNPPENSARRPTQNKPKLSFTHLQLGAASKLGAEKTKHLAYSQVGTRSRPKESGSRRRASRPSTPSQSPTRRTRR